jgi:hypothetical protein
MSSAMQWAMNGQYIRFLQNPDFSSVPGDTISSKPQKNATCRGAGDKHLSSQRINCLRRFLHPTRASSFTIEPMANHSE